MALLNLLTISQSDDQQTFVDKISYNFDQLLSLGTNGIGPTGFSGIQGVPGGQGVQGEQGEPGTDGTKWFVLPSTTTPSGAVLGDLWLQTDTLDILEYVGSPAVWSSLGFTLTSNGVFSEAGTNNLVFTNPSAARSLVLSPLDYGAGTDSPGTANYRLKLIGTSGNPIIKFGINDSGSENNEIYQPFISIQKNSATDWTWNFDNNNGDFSVNLNGNYFTAYRQLSSVSAFDFGAQVKLQSDSVGRLLSFSSASLGNELFHIGRHNALSTTSDRLFSVRDDMTVAFGDAYSNAVTGDTTAFFVDMLASTLSSAVSTNPVHRWRAKVNSTNYNELRIHNVRDFAESGGSPWRSSQYILSHSANNSYFHAISFHGGAKDSSYSARPQLRFAYGSSSNFYFAADVNGRIGIGNSTFIKDYNDSALTNIFKTRLTVQGESTTSITGTSAHTGIHLFTQNTTNSTVGITNGGVGSNVNNTNAGLWFKDEGAVGVSMNFGTSNYSGSGAVNRYKIDGYGDFNWYSKSNTGHSLFFEIGGLRNGSTVYNNDIANIGTYDNSGATWRSIRINAGTQDGPLTFGEGLVGIGGGNGFSETIAAGPNLVVGQSYIAISGTVVHNSVTYPLLTIFQAVNTTLTSGTVALAKPMAKLHVEGSFSVGTRKQFTGAYSAEVGTSSFTIGSNHKASGTRSSIISGHTHTVTGNDSVIIGYNGTTGITVSTANKIALAAGTFLSSTGTPYFSSSNTARTRDNVLSLEMGTSNNGLEIQYLSTSVGDPFAIHERNVSISPNTYTTRFVVTLTGQVGLMTEPLTQVDPLLVTASTWTSYYPDISIKSTAVGNLLFGTSALSTTTATESVSSHITTANKTNNSASQLKGRHLILNPGIARNVNSTTGTAIGGDLILRGGRGEKSPSGVTSLSSYGNVILAYDLANAVSAGQVGIGIDVPTADVDFFVNTVRLFDDSTDSTSSATLATHSGGYRRLYVQGPVTGSGDGTAIAAVDYDRIISIVTTGTLVPTTTVEIGLNEYYSVSSGSAPYMRIAIGYRGSGCSAVIPAGVTPYVSYNAGGTAWIGATGSTNTLVTGTLTFTVLELKLGRN